MLPRFFLEFEVGVLGLGECRWMRAELGFVVQIVGFFVMTQWVFFDDSLGYQVSKNNLSS
jgi:hypothetical protein